MSGSTFQVSYVLDDVVEILRAGRNWKLFASRPIHAARRGGTHSTRQMRKTNPPRTAMCRPLIAR